MVSRVLNKALFLDRDGVINVERNYVYRIEDFGFVPGVFDLCQTAQDAGLVLIVVTNQAGIGRGYYTEEDFQRITAWMLDRFRSRGVRIGRVYHCPFHPTAGIGECRLVCLLKIQAANHTYPSAQTQFAALMPKSPTP